MRATPAWLSLRYGSQHRVSGRRRGKVSSCDLHTYQNGETHSLYSYAYQLRFGKVPISRSRAGGPIKVEDEPNDRIR
jgi:hypothetical protein